jgi:hypothetical protein
MSVMTPRPGERWGELAFVVGFVVLNTLLPLLFTDLFPFSTMPMFSDAPHELWQLRVFDPGGRLLPESTFSVAGLYVANPRPRIGVRLPFTVNRPDGSASQAEITEAVQRGLAQHPELPYVEVVQLRIGAVLKGSREAVEASEVRRWRIANEGYAEALPQH